MTEIYRNKERIQTESLQKERDAERANKTIKKLKKTGMELNDKMLSNLFHNPKALVKEAERQAEEELRRISKFNFFAKGSTSSLFVAQVEEILDDYDKYYRSFQSQGSKEYLIIKNGKAEVDDTFYKKLEKEYVVKVDTPEKEKAYELANKAMEAINELEDYMKEHGDGIVHGVSGDGGIYSRCLVLLSGNMDNWEWKPRIYPFAIKHIIK